MSSLCDWPRQRRAITAPTQDRAAFKDDASEWSGESCAVDILQALHCVFLSHPSSVSEHFIAPCSL